MSFLKTLLLIVVAVCVALFCFNNWTVATVNLWDGLVLETRLPLLLAAFFLAGLIPPLTLWQATKWQLRRQRMIDDGATTAAARHPVSSQLAAEGLTVPPSGPVMPVPPGGA